MRARWSQARTLETVILTGVLVLVALGGVYLIVQTFHGLGPAPPPRDDRLNGELIVAFGFLAFICGRLAHLLRRRQPVDKWHPPRWGAAAWTRAGVLAFFAACVFLLSYEAIGLWMPNGVSPWGIHPITHYVRYAKEHAALSTGIITVIVSFLIGHWLWPPSRSGPEGADAATKPPGAVRTGTAAAATKPPGVE
jgi:hypothetical protein